MNKEILNNMNEEQLEVKLEVLTKHNKDLSIAIRDNEEDLKLVAKVLDNKRINRKAMEGDSDYKKCH